MSKSVLWGINKRFEAMTLDEFGKPWKLAGFIRDLLVRKYTQYTNFNSFTKIVENTDLGSLILANNDVDESDTDIILYHLATDGVFFWDAMPRVVEALNSLIKWSTDKLMTAEDLVSITGLRFSLDYYLREGSSSFKFFMLQDTTSDERVIEFLHSKLPTVKDKAVKFLFFRPEFAKVVRTGVVRVWNTQLNYLRVCGSNIFSIANEADLSDSTVTLYGLTEDLELVSLRGLPKTFSLLKDIRDVIACKTNRFTSFKDLCDVIFSIKFEREVGACSRSAKTFTGLDHTYANFCKTTLDKVCFSLASNGIFKTSSLDNLLTYLRQFSEQDNTVISSTFSGQLVTLMSDLSIISKEYKYFLIYDSTLGLATLDYINNKLPDLDDAVVRFCSIEKEHFESLWNSEEFDS